MELAAEGQTQDLSKLLESILLRPCKYPELKFLHQHAPEGWLMCACEQDATGSVWRKGDDRGEMEWQSFEATIQR